MKKFKKWFKKIMGSDGENAQVVEKKSQEADTIKHAMTEDIARIKKKVDRLNKNTYNKLNEISVDLESVTYKIAVATGAKKRGLK